jgi:hypothetical protein
MFKKIKEVKEEERVETDPAILEFLAKGGVIQKIGRNVSSREEGASYSSWSKKKPSTSPLASTPEDHET